MASKKEITKESLKAGLNPLLRDFKDFLTANAPNGVLGDKEPLHITFTLKKEGVQTQGMLKYGRDKNGVCGWYEPDEYVGICLSSQNKP